MTAVDDYIASLPDDIREPVTLAADAIRGGLPGAPEKVRYGMAAIIMGGRYAIHLAGWKKHLGIYPVAELEPDLEAQVARYRSGKDSLRFPYRDTIPYDLIEKVAFALGRQHAETT
ncbi:iron chaperone [Mumia sp. Pv 4-285]|uniref:iron chaperone n=1 Tax=Mumia qirimensis TaxID=3234852 RepID=UPI00351D0ABD